MSQEQGKTGERFTCLACGRNGFTLLDEPRPAQTGECPECGADKHHRWPGTSPTPSAVMEAWAIERARAQMEVARVEVEPCPACAGLGLFLSGMGWGPCGTCGPSQSSVAR